MYNSRFRRKHRRLYIVFFGAIALLLALLIFMDNAIRPIITKAAANEAEIITTNAVNNSVSSLLKDLDVSYSDIAVIGYDENKKISSLEIDTIELNYLKSQITKVITEEMKNHKNASVAIPTGTLTSNKYLIGRGPRINFNMDLSVAVTTDFKSEFSDAGINNTLHQIIISVSATILIMMPWYQTKTKYITSFILAQTVIIGQVPDSYTSVFDGTGDIVGDVFDYGADAAD